MSSDVSVKLPLGWVSNTLTVMKREKRKKGYNWITLYCSRLNSDPLMASATLNNSPRPAGLEATTSLSWPQVDGFYGARLFILIKI